LARSSAPNTSEARAMQGCLAWRKARRGSSSDAQVCFCRKALWVSGDASVDLTWHNTRRCFVRVVIDGYCIHFLLLIAGSPSTICSGRLLLCSHSNGNSCMSVMKFCLRSRNEASPHTKKLVLIELCIAHD
jgi:hypothetical protein